MTINDLIAEVSEINTANGWREDRGEITRKHPMTQIAALTWLDMAEAELIEGLRKGVSPDRHYELCRTITQEADGIHSTFLDGSGLPIALGEDGLQVRGSKTEALAMLRLIDTETAEASEAILKGEVDNLAEELADVVIRTLDFVGAWNETHDQKIDLEQAIRAKLDKNRTRGYRHGGKLA